MHTVSEGSSFEPRAAGTRGPRAIELAAWAIVVAGVVARTLHLATNRSLWADEASLALNILFRRWGALVGDLDHAQVAPVGSLVLEKAATSLFGPREWVLRLVPFLLGCAAMPVTWALARRIVGPVAALVALGIVAASPQAIYFSAELKQYSGDLFVCVGLLLATERHREAPGDPGRFLALLAAGAVAPWFSHPSVFVLAAIGLGLALAVAARGSRDRFASLASLATLGAGWAASFGLLWMVSLSRDLGDSFLVGFWEARGCFPPPRVSALPSWLAAISARIMADPVGLPWPGMAAAVAVAGLVILFTRRRGFWGVVFALLLAIATTSAALRIMPLCDRLVLYLVPVAALLVAVVPGVAYARPWISTAGGKAIVALASLAVLAACASRYPIERILHPPLRQDLRPVLERLSSRWHPGDAVLVHYETWPPFEFYRRVLGLQFKPVSRLGNWGRGQRSSEAELDAIRPPSGRTWYVGVKATDRGRTRHKELLAALGREGVRLESIEAADAGAWLYDLRPRQTTGSAVAPTLPLAGAAATNAPAPEAAPEGR